MKEQPTPPRMSMPWKRGVFALALTSASLVGGIELASQPSGHAMAETAFAPTSQRNLGHAVFNKDVSGDNIHQEKALQAHARRDYALYLAQLAAQEAARTTTTSSTTSTTSTTTPPPPTTVATTTTTTAHTAPVETSGGSSLYAAWTKVADCEEGGWIGYAGPSYPDSLGINSANWYAFGGGSDVSPAAQIAVAERLIQHYGAAIPDQNGCQPGGW